jgi:hypothetical protein
MTERRCTEQKSKQDYRRKRNKAEEPRNNRWKSSGAEKEWTEEEQGKEEKIYVEQKRNRGSVKE